MVFGGTMEEGELLEIIFYAFEFLATLGKLRRKCSVSRLPRRGREKFSARKVFVALMPDK
jgi:hypothetical protein